MHPTWVLSLRPLVEATGAESGAVMLSLQARLSACEAAAMEPVGALESLKVSISP